MKERSTIKQSKTNWTKLAKMGNSEIDSTDIPDLDRDFFRKAVVRMPKPKKMVSIRLDEEILNWFKKDGKGYQTKINEILKMYVRAKAA